MEQRIPVLGGETPRPCSDTGENLAMYLSDVGDEWIEERIGKEKITSVGEVIITKGQTFKNRSGSVTGGRYLMADDKGEFVGALNYTKLNGDEGRKTVISNIYVRRDFRRQGVATKLIETLKANERNVFVDRSMTLQGGLLFGYKAPKKGLKF